MRQYETRAILIRNYPKNYAILGFLYGFKNFGLKTGILYFLIAKV